MTLNLFKLELPTLYARSSTGAVLEWDIEIEGDKYRTTTGQQGGQKITSKWTVAAVKNVGQANSTTAEQQAEAEAVAKWKKKIKREGYWEDIKDIDKKGRFIEPMLAHRLNDHPEKVVFPCMVDRKYNGGRMVASIDGLFTRKGERYESVPHIAAALQPLFDKYPDLVLDGEGYNHDLRFKLNELMSILRTNKAARLTGEFFARSESIVRLYVYDGYGFNGITSDTGNIKRREALKALLKDIPYVVWVPFKRANTMDEVYAIYEEYVADGHGRCNHPKLRGSLRA